ncbi:MAG TPA: ComEC/Rec2 family competence protein, partial [Anaeromyxobacter sp.]
MGGRTAVGAAAALWLGLIGARTTPLVIAATLLVIPLAWLAWRAPDRTGTLALMLALACAGALRGAAHEAALGRARERLARGPELVRAVARVIEPPLRESGEPLATLRIERGAPWLACGARLRLRLPEGCGAEWGDRVRVLARLDLPRPRDNPGGFDARSVADANALIASGRAFAVGEAPASWLDRGPAASAARWRRAIESRLRAGLSSEARELVIPLVTGDRSALPSDVNAEFKASGLVHLLALSGLHVALMAAIARGLCAFGGGGPRARAAAGAACA